MRCNMAGFDMMSQWLRLPSEVSEKINDLSRFSRCRRNLEAALSTRPLAETPLAETTHNRVVVTLPVGRSSRYVMVVDHSCQPCHSDVLHVRPEEVLFYYCVHRTNKVTYVWAPLLLIDNKRVVPPYLTPFVDMYTNER